MALQLALGGAEGKNDLLCSRSRSLERLKHVAVALGERLPRLNPRGDPGEVAVDAINQRPLPGLHLADETRADLCALNWLVPG